MIKAKNKINEFGCNCSKNGKPSLEHELTCPQFSSFLLSCPVDRRKENFISHGYGESITIPNLEEMITYKRYYYDLAEMMQCDCGHWFPRWQYSVCPSCLKGH